MLLSPVLSVSYGRVDEFGGNPLRFMSLNSSIIIIGDSGAQRECNGWRGGGLAKFKGARFVCVFVCGKDLAAGVKTPKMDASA